jgi:hypothetical protein
MMGGHIVGVGNHGQLSWCHAAGSITTGGDDALKGRVRPFAIKKSMEMMGSQLNVYLYDLNRIKV